MVSVLFDKETIEKVKNQFSNNTEIVSVEANDMTFRLFKTKLQNIFCPELINNILNSVDTK